MATATFTIGTGTCNVCHRVLKNPTYVAIGIGPICLRKQQGRDRMSADNTHDIVDLPFDPVTMDIVCRREPLGDPTDMFGNHRCHFNIQQHYKDHSPSGMEWGYLGSGCANYALNILALFVGYDRATYNRLYQEFKQEFVATLPREGGTIKGDEIRAWIAANLPSEAEFQRIKLQERREMELWGEEDEDPNRPEGMGE